MAQGRPVAAVQGLGAALAGAGGRAPWKKTDTAERVLINGLSLLKMIKHAHSGIPLEVVGSLLGRYVDDLTLEIFDCFPTPQIQTGVSVETMDEEFQVKMIALLEAAGYRAPLQVGWYHSHPGFDVWLSDVDVRCQAEMENMNGRCVAVVVDPVKSVRGRVVIGAFRNVPQQLLMAAVAAGKALHVEDPREKTSFIGHTARSGPTTAYHGLNTTFYHMPIRFEMSQPEQHMLESLHRPQWCAGMEIPSWVKRDAVAGAALERLREVVKSYRESIMEEAQLAKGDLATRFVGKVDPRLYTLEEGQRLSERAITQLTRSSICEAILC